MSSRRITFLAAFCLLALQTTPSFAADGHLQSGTIDFEEKDEVLRANKIQVYSGSERRLLAQHELDGGEVTKAREAIIAALKFEPESVPNHLIYARVLTEEFHRNRLDADLYEKCITEWKYVREYGHDDWENDEALNQLMQLRLDRTIAKTFKHRKRSVNAVLIGGKSQAQ